MPKRQECALTISSEHSDLAAASVIWFTCCSQAAAAAAAIRAGSQSICEFSGGSEENPSGTGLKRKRRSVLDSEVSHASDMPKRQECALTISSEHSDLAAASVIWFTCCSQAAAAAAAAIRAGSQSICEFSGGSEENPSGTGLKRKRRSVLDSEVSHASDMPKRQECALTISSEHSDLAAASVIWFTCCSQAAAAAAAIRAG
uniref:Secreted protein n=1 Tax=Macrostomum lignano TaxID=282301 RepID=A0A1I8IK17_9PLAT